MKTTEFTQTFFARITTMHYAKEAIKGAAGAFYGLAGLLIILGGALELLESSSGMELIISGVIYGVLAFVLQQYKSRTIAIILCAISLATFVATTINKLHNAQAGQNVILSLLMIWMSIRAIQGTFFYHKKGKES